MFGVLGSLIGFLSSTAPKVFDHFSQKQANAQELEKMKLIAEMKREGLEFDLKYYKEMGADKEHQRLIEHDIALSQDNGFIGALRKSVRPMITYAFFALFVFVELLLAYQVYQTGGSLQEISVALWTPETQGIWAAIISFWFGSRAIEKMKR